MIKAVGSRLLQTAATLVFLATATFWLLRALPGGPFDSEIALAPEVKSHLEQRYHLDRPLLEQYWTFAKSLGLGDLGTSFSYLDQNVSEIIRDMLPVTLKLGVMALILSFVTGLALGLAAARFHGTLIETALMFFAVGAVSMPVFLLAPLLIFIFSFWLDWLPPALWDGPQYYILPVVTLATRPAAMIARLVRASALDIIHSDFVRTAEAKGVSEWKVLCKHVLKNSVVPVLGVAGPVIAGVLSGSFIIEVLFAVPGLGRHFIESVLNRDYPLIMALTLFYGAILSLANLLMDLIAMAVDPRVKMS